MFHEDLAHHTGSHTEEMGTILPLRDVVAHQANVSFVDQSRALQGVVGTFALQVVVGDLTQFGVDQRNQIVERLLISAAPADKELRNLLLGRVASHRGRPKRPGGGAFGLRITRSTGAVNLQIARKNADGSILEN